jgi:hypothetical protein
MIDYIAPLCPEMEVLALSEEEITKKLFHYAYG